MTGAGSAAPVAWAPETSYLGGTEADPTYREPGANVQVQRAELSRNLLAILAPDDPEAQDFLSTFIEGQLSVSWILKNDEFHRLLFNGGFTGFTSGLANSAEWYLGVDYYGAGGQATTERQIKGWTPATAEITYNGSTEAVRVTITGPYGDEEQNTSISSGTVQRAGDEVPGHAATLSVDGTDVTKLQNATVAFSQISRLQRGADPRPLDAVAGNVQEDVSMAAIYSGPERYELALGSAGATTTDDTVDAVPATLSFDAGGSTIAEYGFATTKVDTYDWSGLADNDADLEEDIGFLATGLTASDPTT
jgi:hypothetical protein